MDYMIIIDQSYCVVWANERALSLFPDLLNNTCHRVIHGSKLPCDPCIGEGCFRKGGTYEREGACIIPDSGERMDFWSTTSIVTRHGDGSPELILELFRDITEKKAYEAEAVRVGQLASLGELAAGVAHEINNPINGILNYGQILLEKTGRASADHEILQRIVQEGERVTGIVHNLLSFARVRKDEFVSTSLDEVISSCLGLVAKQLANDGISLRIDTGRWAPEALLQQPAASAGVPERYQQRPVCTKSEVRGVPQEQDHRDPCRKDEDEEEEGPEDHRVRSWHGHTVGDTRQGRLSLFHHKTHE